jgi:hypothetical protein
MRPNSIPLKQTFPCSKLNDSHSRQPRGTLVRMSRQELEALPGKGSVHQLGFADLLLALRVLAHRTPEVVLLGVQPSKD